MISTDEDILRDLLRSSTDDLHAAHAVTDRIISRQLRIHRRNRLLKMGVSGLAATTALAIVAEGITPKPGHSVSGTRGGTAPSIRLTASQKTLYGLAKIAAAAPIQQGRYVVLTEKQDGFPKTSVLDSETGDIWSYQQVPGAPEEAPVVRHWSPTAAEFEAMPTDIAALRADLLKQAIQDDAWAQQEMAQQLIQKRKAGDPAIKIPVPKATTKVSDTDRIFEQAADLLWNPLVGPRLRAALFDLLATTPGVTAKADARDSLGRPATELTRTDDSGFVTISVFQDPATAGTLQLSYIYPSGNSGDNGSDVFLSTKRTATLPANPYAR